MNMFAQTLVRAPGMRTLCRIPKVLLLGDSVFILLFDDKSIMPSWCKIRKKNVYLNPRKPKRVNIEIILKCHLKCREFIK